jgi:predicted Zn-dependent protease
MLQLTLAKAYQAKGETDSAIKACDRMLATSPNQVDVLKLKADLLFNNDRASESIKLLEQAYALTPYDLELNYALANQYAETENSKVLALCDSLIKIDTLGLYAEPYYLKGIYYSNKMKM